MPRDRATVERLYAADELWMLVAPASTCWDLDATAKLVCVLGTEAYDGARHRYVDYDVTDVLEMTSKAGRPGGVDDDAACAVFCHAPKQAYLKRALYEPLPVESRLDDDLHDHVNAEVVARTIESKQDCVDYLTWTFYYRRLAKNPNYYDLRGASHRHVSDHLSELVARDARDLEDAGCVRGGAGARARAPLTRGV